MARMTLERVSSRLPGGTACRLLLASVLALVVVAGATMPAAAQPAVNATTSLSTGNAQASSLTFAHTTAGANRFLIVGVSLRPSSGVQVSSVTYHGVNLTPDAHGHRHRDSNGHRHHQAASFAVPDADSYPDGYGHPYRDRDRHSDPHRDGHVDPNPDHHADAHGHRHRDCNEHRNQHC